MRTEQFHALTNPSSVAVVGAATAAESWYGGRVYENLLRNDVGREIWPVNSRRAGTELLGRPVHASISELPVVPELTVICVSWAVAPDVLEEAAKAGTKAAVVLGSYKGEDPHGAAAFDARLREIAERYDIVVIGPNSMGIMNGNAQLVATFGSGADYGVPGGNLAFLSQSGAAISFMLQEFGSRGIGYSHLISTGNEADASLAELLEHVVRDPQTDAIMIFLEGSSDGRHLRRVLAEAAVAGKPIALLKVGRSAVGQSAAQSHTGRVANDATALKALLEEVGVQVASSYQELFDFGLHFARRGRVSRPHERRAAVVGTTGGVAVAASDDLVEGGWTVPSFSGELVARLRGVTGGENLPDHLANPIDVTGTYGDTSRLAVKLPEIVRILADCGQFDEVFVMSGAGGPHAEHVAGNLAQELESGTDVPVTVGWIGIPQEAKDALERARVSVLDDPTRAARAASALADASRTPEQLADLEAVAAGTYSTAGPAVTVASDITGGELMQVLGDAGIDVARSVLVDFDASEAELRAEVENLGLPLVAKIDSAELSHKSDAGGVVLGIDSVEELLGVRDRLRSLVEDQQIRARLLVQESIAGIEVLVGARWDASFGHLLVVGLGGTLTELLSDFRATLLPTSRGRIEQIVRGHERLMTLLGGYRGKPPGDVERLVNLIEQVARWLASSGPRVQELDLNPVMVTPDSAVAVDARVVIEKQR